jgi:hypothetical protein
MPKQRNTYRVFWSPEGRQIATVEARDARSAKRKAPKPYRKFLGEIYVELVGCTNLLVKQEENYVR